jgi:hypothetical protein
MHYRLNENVLIEWQKHISGFLNLERGKSESPCSNNEGNIIAGKLPK